LHQHQLPVHHLQPHTWRCSGNADAARPLLQEHLLGLLLLLLRMWCSRWMLHVHHLWTIWRVDKHLVLLLWLLLLRLRLGSS
jgi:hypothetical protein